MAIRWPLAAWRGKFGIASTTRREAILSGNAGNWNGTCSLKDLRKFVARLEQWPDEARVSLMYGAMLQVEWLQKADQMLTEVDD